MKLNDKIVAPAVQKVASHWNLTLVTEAEETRRAYVFKVDSPDGPRALKVYKRLGASGEGAAAEFLRGLPPQVGVKIHKTNFWRAAVLMDWLDGDTLDQLLRDGDEARATQLLADVAQAVIKTDFRLPILYRRVVPGLKKDFATCAKWDHPHPVRQSLDRCIALLDHLIATTAKEQVIHGDLGFSNVILTPQGPRLIDPKGFRADPAFELAKALVMPYGAGPMPAFVARINARGPVLADAIGTTQLRLTQWAAVIMGHKSIYGARKRPEEAALLPYLATLLDLSDR